MEQSPPEQVDTKPIISATGAVVSESSAAGTTTTATSPATSSKLTVAQLNIEILPVIYDIVRCVEKDPTDNAGKQRESQECSHKILELHKRFDSARSQIKQLSGIDYNKEEQLQQLELLKKQLHLKQQLIKKYKKTQL